MVDTSVRVCLAVSPWTAGDCPPTRSWCTGFFFLPCLFNDVDIMYAYNRLDCCFHEHIRTSSGGGGVLCTRYITGATVFMDTTLIFVVFLVQYVQVRLFSLIPLRNLGCDCFVHTCMITCIMFVSCVQVRLTNNQRHLSNLLFDRLLLEEAAIISYCEATLLEKPAMDTADYIAPVRTCLLYTSPSPRD